MVHFFKTDRREFFDYLQQFLGLVRVQVEEIIVAEVNHAVAIIGVVADA